MQEWSWQWQGRYRRKRRTLLNVFKLNLGGCVDCGYNKHPEALEFDHLPGFRKRASVSSLVRHSWGIILDEIAKCELVCANCHRIRTITRQKPALKDYTALIAH